MEHTKRNLVSLPCSPYESLTALLDLKGSKFKSYTGQASQVQREQHECSVHSTVLWRVPRHRCFSSVLQRPYGAGSQYGYSQWSPPAQSNETSNGYFLERSHSARLTLSRAIQLCPEEVSTLAQCTSAWWLVLLFVALLGTLLERESCRHCEDNTITDLQKSTTICACSTNIRSLPVSNLLFQVPCSWFHLGRTGRACCQ